ncbi:hypothetical protein [Burkholderia pseudomallei]|uniref:hypothetical protein n=1 Tax=Burkholderia pseudomallei TaxID=28450 RepID=UPI000AE97CF3|nr:hypothetical protein [Burkholderia pseudomallei]
MAQESVEPATLEWAAWYNPHRLMEPLAYASSHPLKLGQTTAGSIRNAADVPALT